jgi:hypothetical protein
MTKPALRQIGKAGELLVQYRLLLIGIESSQMTTDAGVDLVAYIPAKQDALTIQVKTNLKPKPGGGKGALALDWWVPCDTPAQLIAFVELEQERVWMLAKDELARMAQQQSSGRWHLYIYTESSRTGKAWTTLAEMDRYLMSQRLQELFAV